VQRIFIKKCTVSCLGWEVCHVKRFITWSRNSQERLKVADDARPGMEVAETTVKKTSMLWGSTH
jgi:hypothetical protein